MRPLMIPYAINESRQEIVSAENIAEIMEDYRSTIRLQATARKNTATRRIVSYVCPACGTPLYPHAPRSTGRYYWSHRQRLREVWCPYERKAKLTPDQIQAVIFRGRQEGEAHKNLVALLMGLAQRDPAVTNVKAEAYEPPTPEMREEFPYGRFPDVKFTCDSKQVVLEAQLATITLHGINGRRAFYDRKGIALLWVMRNFDPRVLMRASVRDIIADQGGALFSLDNEVIARSESDGIFRLTVWRHLPETAEDPWKAEIVTIYEAAALARPARWADEFKRRWIETYPSGFYAHAGVPDPYIMLDEIARNAGLPSFARNDFSESTLSLVRLLISLEAGVVTGSGHDKLISLANRFNVKDGYRAIDIVRMADRKSVV